MMIVGMRATCEVAGKPGQGDTQCKTEEGPLDINHNFWCRRDIALSHPSLTFECGLNTPLQGCRA